MVGFKKGKGSPYLISESRVPELIPVLGSQPAGDVSLVFYVSTFYFILWADVSAAYSALLSSSYFERINDDDDDDDKPGGRLPLLSARPAFTPATLKTAATNFADW